MTRMAGRTALVTGAGQGIGRGTALAFAKEGTVVVPNALLPAAEDFEARFPDRFEGQQARVPLRLVGDPEDDVGRAVVALASDDLSHLTSETLMLTGASRARRYRSSPWWPECVTGSMNALFVIIRGRGPCQNRGGVLCLRQSGRQ